MSKHFDVTCEISPEGKLPLAFGERVRDVLKHLAGYTVQFVIQDPKRYSSNPQRQYYFGVIVVEFQHYFASQGQLLDKDDLHEMMMTEIGLFWKEEANPFTGDILRRRRSYNDLSTTEAENYHTLCRQWAAERGFDIPEPNEEKKPKYVTNPPAIEAPVIDQPKTFKQLVDSEEIPT